MAFRLHEGDPLCLACAAGMGAQDAERIDYPADSEGAIARPKPKRRMPQRQPQPRAARTPRPKAAKPKKPSRLIPADVRAKIASEPPETPYTAIGRRYGVSDTAVAKIRRLAGVRQLRRNGLRLSAEIKEKILADNGRSQREIAEDLGISASSVSYARRMAAKRAMLAEAVSA
jgi:hypothetical protein